MIAALTVAWLFVQAPVLVPAPATPDAPTAPTPGLDGVPVKVERRLLVKAHHFFLEVGLNDFARDDYFISPGLAATVTYFWTEQSAIDFSVGFFASFTSASATEVFQKTGLVPDAQMPDGFLQVGYRQSIGYGKLLIGSQTGPLVHFDIELAAHAGLLFTSAQVAPMISAGPVVVGRASKVWFAELSLPLAASFEQRMYTPVTIGVMPMISIGRSL